MFSEYQHHMMSTIQGMKDILAIFIACLGKKKVFLILADCIFSNNFSWIQMDI